jgi:hypothetical protein
MGVILSSRHTISSSAIPRRFRMLPDGRSTAAVIARMDAELRGAAPAGWDGVWTHQAEMFAEIGPKYGVISADVLGCFTVMPDDIGTCLEEITCHAGARMWAAGYRGTIWHGKPRTYWYARHLRQDGPAILLAACDLLRNDRRAIADWYLNTLCGGLCELHKSAGGPRACGSDSCIRADETTCVCACGGVNHGIGVSGFPRELLDLDWDSIPVSQIGRTR